MPIVDEILERKTFPARDPIYTSLAFSNDGKWLLLGTAGDVHYLIDSYEGTVVARLETPAPMGAGPGDGSGLERLPVSPYAREIEPVEGVSGEEVAWSPDARFVLSGESPSSMQA